MEIEIEIGEGKKDKHKNKDKFSYMKKKCYLNTVAQFAEIKNTQMDRIPKDR